MKAPSTQVFIVFTALVLTALNFLFLGALWQHFMIICFDFWYKAFDIYPMFEQTKWELLLLNLFPIIVAVFLIQWKTEGLWRTVIFFFFAYVTVFAATLIGNVLSLMLWGKNGMSPLLPSELRTAPFPFYWLTFVIMGLSLYWFFAKKFIHLKK
jgi:hypothetical protein